MPTIYLTDGTKKLISYDSAAKLRMYLDEPDRLDNIRCGECEKEERPCDKCVAERAEKQDFLMRLERIDWSDLKKPAAETPRVTDRAKLRAVLADDTLKGKAKFDAVREAMGAGKPQQELPS